MLVIRRSLFSLARARKQTAQVPEVQREGAEFEVVAGGLGSMLHIKVPANQHVLTRTRSVVGLSGSASTKLRLESSPLNNVMRGLAGGPFVLSQVKSAPESHSEVLLAPPQVGDIAVIELSSPDKSFHLRRNSFLACSDTVKLSNEYLGSGLGLLIDGWSTSLKASGQGHLGVYASHGTIYRMTLQQGEEYCVHPSYLVAWSSTVKPGPVANENVKQDVVPTTTRLGTFLQYWMLNSLRRLTIGSAKYIKSSIFGEKEALYRLTGPGEFYLSSRLHPRFGNLRSAYAGLKQAGEELRAQQKLLRKSE